jgi:hypothetical protein
MGRLETRRLRTTREIDSMPLVKRREVFWLVLIAQNLNR